MTLLDYTDIQPRVFFRTDGSVYEVLESTFSKKSRQKGSNRVRIKNLITGAVVSKTLRPSDVFEQVFLSKERYVFVYVRNDDLVVHPEGNPSDRITLPLGSLSGIHLIPSGTVVTALLDGSTIVTLRLPIKVEVLVSDSPPSIRGNTTQGGSKQVTVETGATVVVPLFIETGDRIRVNTTTGEYVERVSKQAS